jgi:hypothetical protein
MHVSSTRCLPSIPDTLPYTGLLTDHFSSNFLCH